MNFTLRFLSDKLTQVRSQKNLSDAATALVVRVLAAALAYFVQVFLARMLHLADYGLYVTLWTWLIVVNHITVLGFSESSLRFLPRYTERKQYDWAMGFLHTGFKVVTFGSVLLAAIGFSIIYSFAGLIPAHYLLPIMVIAIGLPITSLELYLEGVSRSFGWYLLTMVPGYVLRPLLIAAGVWLAYLSGHMPDAATVLAIAIAITTVTVVVQTLVIRGRIRRKFGVVAPKGSGKLWVLASLPLVLAMSVEELYLWSDILILGFLVPPEEISVYFAAQRSMALAAFVQYAFMMVSAREFSVASAMRDKKELQRRISSATRWTFWLTVPAVLVTLAAGYPLLWLFGPEFLNGYPIMFVLGLGFVIRASVGQAQDLLIVLGHQKVNVTVSAGGVLFNILLSLMLVPYFGILGAAIATTLTYLIRSVIFTIVLKKLTGLWVLIDLPVSGKAVPAPSRLVTIKEE